MRTRGESPTKANCLMQVAGKPLENAARLTDTISIYQAPSWLPPTAFIAVLYCSGPLTSLALAGIRLRVIPASYPRPVFHVKHPGWVRLNR